MIQHTDGKFLTKMLADFLWTGLHFPEGSMVFT